MLAQETELTSLLAGSPCQSSPARVMICPRATDFIMEEEEVHNTCEFFAF